MKPYPLILKPILKEKVWGGRALEALGKHLSPGRSIGESWEVADLVSSADGGGGGRECSVIAKGPLAGKTLADAIALWGGDLMGDHALTPEGGFPLLVKYLDARENLSVQVHPSPAYAARRPGAHLKTESWFIVHAEPGAVIYKGVKAGVTRDSFERKLRAGVSIVDDLVAVPVRAGDFHHLPSGTCHALGAGIVVAEVQTPSDTTFRVYDWGRAGRALHVEEALECIEFGPVQQPDAIRADNERRARLIDTPFYSVTQAGLDSEIRDVLVEPSAAGSPIVWMNMGAGGTCRAASGEFEAFDFGRGDTILFPACIRKAEFIRRERGIALEIRLPQR